MSVKQQRAKWRAASARWRAKNPGYARKKYRANKTAWARRQRKRIAANPEARKQYQKKINQRVRQRIIAGRKRCDICRWICKPQIDHCYRTARKCGHRLDKQCARCRRGILCVSCNTALGKFLDNPKLLRRAARYIELWRRKHVGV